MNKSYYKLPKIVLTILVLNRAWLVGSSVKWYLSKRKNKKLPRDIDLVIPVAEWNNVLNLLKDYRVKINNFGGLKVSLDEIKIDIWPSNLEDYFNSVGDCPSKIALRLKPYCLVKQLK